ncbi:hypothetical protein ACFQ0R_07230 [Psychroflexus salinarum]|uniref:Uncharacterized protein n=1 Tax=Psychroflexus salinarum TaxID=546024 RepID=A0ABW3GT58_9FLAO
MKFYLLVISLLSLSLSLNAQNSEENKNTTEEVQVPEILTKLKLLEQVDIDGYRLSFKRVVSDGRCPKKVTCVWPGEADVIIEINDGSETVAKKITIPALGFHKEIFSTSTHIVYLKNLAPYPVNSEDKIEAYQLLLKIQPKKS